MFTAQHELLQVSIEIAQTRLVNLVSRDELSHASRHAYQNGLEHMVRVGPLGDLPGVSKLVKVSFVQPVYHEDAMTLGLRWEATGIAGGLFPVLDGDLTLTKADDDTTELGLVASYRPPLGNLGARLDNAILSHVADATIKALLRSVVSALLSPDAATTAPTIITDTRVLGTKVPHPPGHTALPGAPAASDS
jgi:hypothetical protein